MVDLVKPTLNSAAAGRCCPAMASRIDLPTAPSPPNGTPWPAIAKIIHGKNQGDVAHAGP